MKLLANLLCITCMICGCIMLGNPKPPDDTPSVASIGDTAAAVPRVIAALQADNYADVAAQIRDKKLVGEIAAGEALAARNKAAIDAAYKPLDEALQATLGDGKYTDELAAATYAAIGDALKKAGSK
ncbi:MAG: hypothetical protein IPL86_19165 [Flavobacteriales bacterium]|nr:hypothetical protein [Flavobacteriales bacterium]